MDNKNCSISEIEKIDDQIVTLLNQRYLLSGKTSECDFGIQQKILARLTQINKGPMTSEILGAVYREIFSGVRALEKQVKIAFLGPLGTFSHQATMEIFGSSAELVPQKTIPEVFRAVECGRADYGCVPKAAENSSPAAFSAA